MTRMEITAETVYRWFQEIIKERSRPIEEIDVIHVGEASGCLRRAFYDRVIRQPQTDTTSIIITVGTGVHEALQSYLSKNGWKTEVPLKIRIRDSITLVGHADLYHPEYNTVVELKTTGKLPDKPYDSHIMQVNAYSFMLRADKAYIIYITREGKVRVYNIQRNMKLWADLVERAVKLHKALKENRPPPPEWSGMCNYCPYKWRCYSNNNKKGYSNGYNK